MTAQRISPPSTAFRTSKQRRPRKQDNDHLAFIRTLPCLVTGDRTQVEACHIRYADPRYGKPECGIGMKSDDRWVVPLCRVIHADQHQKNERQWWRAQRIDPTPIALALYNSTGDSDVAEVILEQARKSIKHK